MDNSKAAELLHEVTQPIQPTPLTEEEIVLGGKSLQERLKDHYEYITRPSEKSEEHYQEWLTGKDYNWLRDDMIRVEENLARGSISRQHDPGRYVGGIDWFTNIAFYPLLIRSGRLTTVILDDKGKKGLALDGVSESTLAPIVAAPAPVAPDPDLVIEQQQLTEPELKTEDDDEWQRKLDAVYLPKIAAARMEKINDDCPLN